MSSLDVLTKQPTNFFSLTSLGINSQDTLFKMPLYKHFYCVYTNNISINCCTLNNISLICHLNRTKIPQHMISLFSLTVYFIFECENTKAVLFVLQDNLTTHPGCQKGTNLTAKYMGKLTNGDHLHKLE